MKYTIFIIKLIFYVVLIFISGHLSGDKKIPNLFMAFDLWDKFKLNILKFRVLPPIWLGFAPHTPNYREFTVFLNNGSGIEYRFRR